MKSKPFILTAGKIVPSSAATYLETDFVGPNNVFLCQSLCVIDHTHGIATRIETGVLHGKSYIPVRSQVGPFPLNTSMNNFFPIPVMPNQKIYALFETPTQGDYIEILASGFLIEVEKDEKRPFGGTDFRKWNRYHNRS